MKTCFQNAALREYQLKLHALEREGPDFSLSFTIYRTGFPKTDDISHDFDQSLEIASGKCTIPEWVTKNTVTSTQKLFLVDECEEFAVASLGGTLQLIELKFEQQELRPLARHLSFAAPEKSGAQGFQQGGSSESGLIQSRYIDSWLSGAVIKAQFYREKDLRWPQTAQKERKGVLSLLQLSRLRLYALQASESGQTRRSEAKLQYRAESNQLTPLLIVSLDTCIPLSMVPVAATIERLDFRTGSIDLWVVAKSDRLTARTKNRADRANDGLTSGRDTERSRAMLDIDIEADPAHEMAQCEHPSALCEEIFHISSEPEIGTTRVVRCLLMDTHHLETLSNTSLIKSNYSVEVARYDGSIAILLTKGSELYLALLLDLTELQEAPVVHFTMLWDEFHPNISRFHGLPVIYTEESLVCFNLRKFIAGSNRILLDSVSEGVSLELSEFISRLNESSAEFYTESAEPRYQKPPIKTQNPFDSKSASNDGLLTHLFLHPPLAMIPCSMPALLSLNQTDTVKSALLAKQDQSSIVSPFVPAAFLNPPPDKPHTAATAKQQLTDFKEYATTQLKLMLNSHTDLISQHAEQMCFELDGWKRSKQATELLAGRVDALLAQNGRIQTLKAKVFGLANQIVGRPGGIALGSLEDQEKLEAKFEGLTNKAKESLAEIKNIRIQIKGLLDKLCKVEFKPGDRAQLDETITNLKTRLRNLRKAHNLPEPKKQQMVSVASSKLQSHAQLSQGLDKTQSKPILNSILLSELRDSATTLNNSCRLSNPFLLS